MGARRILAGLLLALACGAPAAAAADPAPVVDWQSTSSAMERATMQRFATAAGRPLVSTTTLPADLSTAGCVVAQYDRTARPAADLDRLASYVRGGGTLLLLGEHRSYEVGNASYNGLLTALGSGLRIVDGVRFEPDGTTTDVVEGPATTGVKTLSAVASSDVSVGGSAAALVRIQGVNALGAERVGGGLLVVSGDSNFFTDLTFDLPGQFPRWEDVDNRVLVANLCAPRDVELALTCPADAVEGAAVACEVRATDVRKGGYPFAPAGEVVVSSACIEPVRCALAATTEGASACRVTLTAGAAPRSLGLTYAGSVRHLAATGTGELRGTPKPAPPASGQSTGGGPAAPTGGSGARACLSRRTLTATLRAGLDRGLPLPRDLRGARFASARLLDTRGKVVRRPAVSRRAVRADFRGLPDGTYRLSVRVRLRGGRTITVARSYRTCGAGGARR